MNKIIYILSLFVLFACSTVSAQKYKTHRVKSGETIESIAKKYKVSNTDIYKLNPDAKQKLKTNSILIIPKLRSVTTTTTIPTTTSTATTEKVVEKTFERYIKHKTKGKGTLFSISKKYNIEIEDIKKHNRFLYANSLRKGDVLKIPVFKTEVKYVKDKKAIYVVQPKEGKLRIANKYGITVQELEALNPEISGVLKPGQTLNVPNLEVNKVKMLNKKFSYYKVLPAEGFYRLKVKLGLEQTDLERLNPELTSTGLKEGMILKIPFDDSIISNQSDNTNNNTSDVTGATLESIKLSNIVKDSVTDLSIKNIAVMLPFTLNKIDSDSVFDAKQKIKKDRTLNITLDFYSGVLAAFDSLKKLGINLKVDVYDTQNKLSQVNSIIKNNNFSNTQAVIGPLLNNNFNAVSSALERDNTPVVSPIMNKVNVGRNVFLSRPKDENLKAKIIDYFKTDSTSQIIVVSDEKHKATSNMLKAKFPNAILVSSRLDKKTKKDAYNLTNEDFTKVIKEGNNVVFLETENAGFVSNVASVLNGLQTDEIKIILATTDRNKAFENEEVSEVHLSNLHFIYPSISKILDSEESNSFVKQYKQQYNISPNEYVIRGFDITMDVVLRMVACKDLYQSVIDAPLTSYIENKFSYKKKSFGGYYNESVYIVQYNDLKIEEVKQ